jgi:transcriptional regulator with XRE-family HTH domain
MDMTEPELLTHLGTRIKELRLQKSISQNELALQCDIQKASMSRIEAGKTNITMRTLYKIIHALEADVKEVFLF